MKLSDDVYVSARSVIASRLGLDFPEARRVDMERGLIGALRAASISTPEGYLAWLAALPDRSREWERLAGFLTVGETYFFRDRASFDGLERHVLPALIAARRSEGLRRLRVWSAGCATGEEPYSLAILLDRLLPDRSDWSLTILATDINSKALEKAEQGRYREWSFRQTPPWLRERYFRPRGEGVFEIDPRIREIVTFAPLNLAEKGYPDVITNTSAMDVILCRNVLMYFTHEAQRATVDRLRRALATGGWLVVSPAEASLDLLHPLRPVNFPDTIFYRKEAGSQVGPVVGVSDASEVFHTADAPVLPLPPVASPPNEPVDVPPGTPPDLQRARALADQGNLEAGRLLCESVLAQDRLDAQAHLLLAAICQELGDSPAAVEALRRVIYLVPDCAPAHFLMGSLLLREGKRERGRRCLETVVTLLGSVPCEEAVVWSDGFTAGRLLETARAHLELL